MGQEKLAILSELDLRLKMANAITMTGADGVHRKKNTAVSSRLVLFPDGLTRLISLTGWQWEVLDTWPEKTGWHDSRLLEQALEIARIVRDEDGSESFEDDLRHALVALLQGEMVRCIDLPFITANEN